MSSNDIWQPLTDKMSVGELSDLIRRIEFFAERTKELNRENSFRARYECRECVNALFPQLWKYGTHDITPLVLRVVNPIEDEEVRLATIREVSKIYKPDWLRKLVETTVTKWLTPLN